MKYTMEIAVDINAESASEYNTVGMTSQELLNSCKTQANVSSISSSKRTAASTIRFLKLLSTTVNNINIMSN
uniref:Uncharacterized protein n=1 Tax=Rhizophagus irregularis (strain DAOM 181602 / DAOM 197198 / MUCL 43194) TaxID=747089 RepID=U9SPQ2_RHIID